MEQTYTTIPLTQGQHALVDVADREWLSQWSWCAIWSPGVGGYYAHSNARFGGVRRTISMHRMILGLSFGDGLYADHINHATLDNRRINLRRATAMQQQRNRLIQKNNTSGITGVRFRPDTQKWRAQTKLYGRSITIGLFNSAEEAALAYRETVERFLNARGEAL